MLRRIWLTIVLIVSAIQAQALDRDEMTAAKLLRLREVGIDISKGICSKPLRVKNSTVANKHDETVLDSVRTVTCPGFEVETYYTRFYTTPNPLLSSVALFDPRRKLPEDLAIGVSKAKVLGILGTPDTENSEGIYYLVPDEGPCSDGISFLLRNDSVTQIVWGFCIE